MTKKVGKYLYWTPRILSILFICFLSLFSLDVIQPGLSTSQIIVGMLIHNIPSFILIAVLIVSWKHEIVGGVAFITAGLLYAIIVIVSTAGSTTIPWFVGIIWSIQIAGPAFLVGILFLINWRRKKSSLF